MPGYPRLLALGGLLIVEYLLVSLLFDARALRFQDGPLAALAYLGDVATVVLLACAGVLIVRGPMLNQRLAAALSSPTEPRRVWPYWLLHALAYAAFVALSARVLREGAPPDVVATWVGPWLLSGVLLVVMLVLVALPLAALRPLLASGASALLVAVAMGALIWSLATAGELLWPYLSGPTLRAAGFLLASVSGLEVVRTEDLLFGTPDFVVHIAPVCSGLEGMGLMLAFLGGFMIVHRKSLRLPGALWLLPVAVFASFCANIVRLVALVLVGTFISPDVAVGGFHSKAGWFLFCVLAFGFIVLLRRSRWFVQETDAAETETAAPSEISAYLMPLLGLLAAMLVTGLWTTGFDASYFVRMAVAAALLFHYRAHYRSLWARPSLEAVAIGVVVFAVWIALVPRHDPTASRSLTEGLSALGQPLALAWIVARILGSVVIIPIVEELAFRGYVLRRLIARDFSEVPFTSLTFVSFVVSSLAFGLMHSAPLAGTLAGMAYALAQYRRGRIADAIVAHAVTNGLIAIDVLANGAWALW
jgi:exosortase E/protease (VPEID-CTERM system)